MKPAWLSTLGPFNRLLFFVLLMIAVFGVVVFAGMALAVPLFGLSPLEITAMLSDYENPEAIRILKYFQILQSFGLFIIPPLLAGYFFERNITGYLHLNQKPFPLTWILILLLFVVMMPFVNAMITWNEAMKLPPALAGMEAWMRGMEDQAAKLTHAFLHVETFGGFALNIFMIAILPAVGEEFLFRGVIQRLLGEWTRNIHIGIFLSALAFSAMHLQFYGFFPRFYLGLLFGYLFYWTGSLWVPVFAHFLNNAVAVVADQLIVTGAGTKDFDTLGSDIPVVVVTSVALTGILLYMIRRIHVMKAVHADAEVPRKK